MDLQILLKNNYFIVINKPPDLVINSTDPERPSLQKQLVKHYPSETSSRVKFGFYFPHRLDFSTSGVICVARDKKSCAAASSSFQDHSSCKLYLALLRGRVEQPALDINVPIGEKEKVDQEPAQKMVENGAKAREAATRLVVLQRGLYQSQPATKVLLRPLTGRRHQLRVHCRSVGHTVVGDYTYSDGADVDPPRMYLHSYRLKLPNSLCDIDVTTADPFTEATVPGWTVTDHLRVLNEETMASISSEHLWRTIVQQLSGVT